MDPLGQVLGPGNTKFHKLTLDADNLAWDGACGCPVGGKLSGSFNGTVEGTLTVGDPDAFSRLLARGIGRHRAFGFGMLLLRPAR